MKITSLQLENFKGFNAAFALDAVTVVAGANFAHKTSIPLAIRLGLAGYLPPPLGTKALYELAGNPTGAGHMSITLGTDNGRKIVWSWTRDQAGKVSKKGAVTEDLRMPELLLDPRLFFAKTANEQVSTIFNLCELPQTFTPDTLINRFGSVQFPPRAECDKVVEQAIAKVKELHPNLEALTDWLSTMIAQSREQAKIATGGFEACRAMAPEGRGEECNTLIEEARKDLADLHKEQGQGDGGMSTTLGLLQRRLEGYKATPAEYDAEISDLEEALCAPTLPSSELPRLVDLVNQSRPELSKVNAEIAAFKEKIELLESAECCPTCESKKPNWKKAALTNLGRDLALRIPCRDGLIKSIRTAEESINQIQDYESALKKQTSLKKEKAELIGLLDKIAEVKGLLAKQAQAQGDLPQRIQALQARIDELQQKQGKHELWKQDNKRRDNLEASMLAATCQEQAFKAIKAIAVEEQGKLITSAFAQVLNVAKYFTDGLLNSPLEFVDGGLGRRISAADHRAGSKAPLGSWIGFDTFSGTEELLALAGFGVALCGDAPIKLVVLDEMGRLDSERKIAVAQRMFSLTQSGVIDQAILIDVDPRPYGALVKPGFTILKV